MVVDLARVREALARLDRAVKCYPYLTAAGARSRLAAWIGDDMTDPILPPIDLAAPRPGHAFRLSDGAIVIVCTAAGEDVTYRPNGDLSRESRVTVSAEKWATLNPVRVT